VLLALRLWAHGGRAGVFRTQGPSRINREEWRPVPLAECQEPYRNLRVSNCSARGGSPFRRLGGLDNLERAKRYRQRAAEMLKWANLTGDAEQRRLLLAIAAMYHRLAEELEREHGSEKD
jgi:hypothetical protein